MNGPRIDVNLEGGTLTLVDADQRLRRYIRHESVPEPSLIHAFWSPSTGTLARTALLEANDFPKELFVSHERPEDANENVVFRYELNEKDSTIDEISMRNFKSLRDVYVSLERFTVFVGPNASGKSSILRGLDLLCKTFQVKAGGDENEINQGLSRGADKGSVVLTAKVQDKWYRYRRLSPNRVQGPAQQHDGREVSNDGSGWQLRNTAERQTPPLPSSMLLHLETSNLKNTAAFENGASMSENGLGMHTVLANMTLNDPDSWQNLQDDLRHIIPTIQRLRHTRTGTPQHFTSVLFDAVGADSLTASEVSEGTLLVLGLLTVLHSTNRPSLILLDDLDRGLHPKAQKDLVALLRRLLSTDQNLQIAATTHSPYLLDHMKPTEVRMTLLDDRGSTVCAPLDKHPDFDKWKKEMTPGELWSLFGEKWLNGIGASS